jgi:hypothetical protein
MVVLHLMSHTLCFRVEGIAASDIDEEIHGILPTLWTIGVPNA